MCRIIIIRFVQSLKEIVKEEAHKQEMLIPYSTLLPHILL